MAGQVASVEFLLDTGISTIEQRRSATCNAATYGNRIVRPTPLWAACDNGREDVVKLLIDRGADLEVVNEGQTPLECALFRNHGGVAALLRSAGAKEPEKEKKKKGKKIDLSRFVDLGAKLGGGAGAAAAAESRAQMDFDMQMRGGGENVG